jgi:apolipoprotein N-acyltransferase
MPFWMAGFATFCLCAFLALFPAAVGYLSKRSPSVLIAAPLLWVVSEWVRDWIFTGFPWLAVGYSQAPFSPLAAIAPVLGVFGISMAVTASASLVLLAFNQAYRRLAFMSLIGLYLVSGALNLVSWVAPQGKPISVSLLQGNIPQDLKWTREIIVQTINQYAQMTAQTKSDLVVLPETALPVAIDTQQTNLKQDQVLAPFFEIAANHHQSILVGTVESEQENYYNSVLGINENNIQSYRKSHLVPFGEFIPFKNLIGWVYRDWLNMPLSDLSRGSKLQQPMTLANQKIALNICYEDVFGEEIIRQLPQATMLVNVSNDAWYGHSIAAYQHLQFSQMRSLETGRMMLRATNTGATAIIGHHGELIATLPHFTTAILNGTVQGYTGTTPYVRWGNWLIISLLLIALILLWGRKKK